MKSRNIDNFDKIEEISDFTIEKWENFTFFRALSHFAGLSSVYLYDKCYQSDVNGVCHRIFTYLKKKQEKPPLLFFRRLRNRNDWKTDSLIY